MRGGMEMENQSPYILSSRVQELEGELIEARVEIRRAEALLRQACQETKLRNGRDRGGVQPILSNLDEYGDKFTREIEAFLRRRAE
jgi:hypothetical protein